MKTRRFFVVLAALFFVFSSLVFPQKDPRTLKFPDLEFKPQKPGFMNIKKGVDFYFKEDHEQPSLNAFLIIKTGSLSDPKDKEGLAALTLQLMKSGGTKNLTPEKVEEKLDFLGSTLSCNAGTEFSRVNLWTLSKNFDESL
jgi:zinc protease